MHWCIELLYTPHQQDELLPFVYRKRAHVLEHLRGLEAAGWGGSGRWPAM